MLHPRRLILAKLVLGLPAPDRWRVPSVSCLEDRMERIVGRQPGPDVGSAPNTRQSKEELSQFGGPPQRVFLREVQRGSAKVDPGHEIQNPLDGIPGLWRHAGGRYGERSDEPFPIDKVEPGMVALC